MSLSAAIMHVPDSATRRASMITLLKTLRADPRASDVYLTTILDPKRYGVWPTARRAWMMANPLATTHHLVLQDDVLPCRDLLSTCLRIASLVPGNPVCLFDMSKATADAIDAGTNWVTRRSLSSSVALMMPSAMALAAIRWADTNVKPSVIHDDARISMYLLEKGIEVYITAPSLVEHVGEESLVGNPRLLPGRRERKARTYIGAAVSGMSIDWEASIARPHRAWSHSPREYEAYRIDKDTEQR